MYYPAYDRGTRTVIIGKPFETGSDITLRIKKTFLKRKKKEINIPRLTVLLAMEGVSRILSNLVLQFGVLF